ncbi:MAG: UDP-glucose/GDP-mannose dehydrogenase family protein [Polyangiaceae bacterium]
MRLVTFGAGYVGLVSGTGLAELGHTVLVVDTDETRIAMLQKGDVPIYEPGLKDLVRRNRQNGRLSFATQVTPPWDGSDIYFVSVGTPAGADGTPDLRAVHAVADDIRRVAKKKALVCVKSTVPVGTCDAVQAKFEGSAVPLEVASNPEFLKEGDAINDFFKPDRVIVGVRSPEARNVLRRLYAPLQLSGERLVVTDPRSSELVKYAANTMLAMRVSFMNELSRLCHATGADIHAVRMGVGSDSRIGKRFLYSGPGYGGSCFPKDVQALAALGRTHGVPLRLAEATHVANEEQASFIATLVEDALGGVRGKRIAFWGLSFKPETDDVREAPSIRLAKTLLDRGASVVGHDPEAGTAFRAVMGDRVQVESGDYAALDGADALVLLTEWRSYRAPDFGEIRRRLRTPADGSPPPVVDARNVWRSSEVTAAGLRYHGVGVSAAR